MPTTAALRTLLAVLLLHSLTSSVDAQSLDSRPGPRPNRVGINPPAALEAEPLTQSRRELNCVTFAITTGVVTGTVIGLFARLVGYWVDGLTLTTNGKASTRRAWRAGIISAVGLGAFFWIVCEAAKHSEPP